MQLFKADPDAGKGWYAGPWNTGLAVSVGYANVGIDEPHAHAQITEIYLVARGESRIRVGSETVRLAAGDVLVVEPGEPHTFLDSTPGYFHFVVHTPGLSGEAARTEKRPVPRAQLGL
jgi:mannose-6-phosphate isomerase-like protein (cupin superfamily)